MLHAELKTFIVAHNLLHKTFIELFQERFYRFFQSNFKELYSKEASNGKNKESHGTFVINESVFNDTENMPYR